MITRDRIRAGSRLCYTSARDGSTYIVEVVSLEERGAVCDLLSLSDNYRWRNIGHRSLMPYERLTLL